MRKPDILMRSRLYQATLWGMAFALLGLGVYLSEIRFLNTEWLSRSGCAVVILGIWSSLGVIIQERVLFGRLRWRRRNAITEAKARADTKSENSVSLDKEIEEINQAFDKASSDLMQKLKLSLGALEVSLLITGTFFWGFGDLFVQ